MKIRHRFSIGVLSAIVLATAILAVRAQSGVKASYKFDFVTGRSQSRWIQFSPTNFYSDETGYSIWSEDGKDGINGAMLFDPHADPLEMKNLADDEKYKSVVSELSALTRKYAATLDAA